MMGPTKGADSGKNSEGHSAGIDRNAPAGAKHLWTKAVDRTAQQMMTGSGDIWLSNTRFVAEVDNAILIATRDQVTQDRIDRDYALDLKRNWRSLDQRQ
ncbi:MAG: hypothetical protein AAGF20_08525 [Pseudomonadota bacterium]